MTAKKYVNSVRLYVSSTKYVYYYVHITSKVGKIIRFPDN